MTRFLALCLTLAVLAGAAPAATPGPGFHPRVRVEAATGLDWTFVLTTQSLLRPPELWKMGEHDSKKQTYELYVPRRNKKTALPLLLYLSPAGEPGGWPSFEKLVRGRGLVFASPRGAGNDCPPPRRVRIVLDVLDDVRRQFPIDPDRTYIAGFSGGGRIASGIAFALPELFGGVLPICASSELRQESWLRQRVIDRLSVALVTGEKDFNRGEVERWRGPMLKEVGVRARVWTVPGMGHALPDVRVQNAAYRYLEDGLAKRQALAKTWPASRYPSEDGSREALARALLEEGKKRLGDPKTLYSGLMQVQGAMKRWPDLEAGRSARKLLEEYEDRKDKPWQADDVAEQRRFLAAEARGLDRYASGPLDPRYRKLKPDMIRKALSLYEKLALDDPDSALGKEAKQRAAALNRLLKD
jgi:poly(3-hydroxybutyrate) depolymerase